MGTPDFSVPVLDALVAADYEIAAVYSQPPRPAGRGKKDRPSPVHRRAVELDIPVHTPLNFKATEDVRIFTSHNADVAIVVAYGLILPQQILDTPNLGCINIHASLLPRWRGAAPIQRAIMAGDPETGVCLMQMEKGLDTGPVYARAATPITLSDTYATLHDKLSDIGSKLLVDTLPNIADLSPQPQPVEGITYATKIDKSEARIDWHQPAIVVDQQIRGLSPFPGAWFEIDGNRIKVLDSRLAEESGPPGQIVDAKLRVACGEHSVDLLRLQRAGKSAQDVETFLRGYPLKPGTVIT